MKREEQQGINELCECIMNFALEQIVQEEQITGRSKELVRLRNCQAWVIETADYYILRSYNTLVAIIEKDTGTLYDILRTTYGYTATSAQHIRKFLKDYGKGMWGCEDEYTAR